MNKILLIDDDKDLCALIQKNMLQEDISSDCCYSGKDGLIKLKENKYQLVILDVIMPGDDGFAILEKIREISSLPVLMFTSKDDSASKVRGLRTGEDDYLTKPFEMDELKARDISLIRRYTYFNQKDVLPETIIFTYKPTKRKMDVDLRKFPLIPYNTTQAGIGGNLRKFLHFPFITHTTKNLKTAKNGRKKTGNRFLISCFGVPPVMGGGYSVFLWLQLYKW